MHPLSDDQCRQILDETRRWVEKANDLYGLNEPPIEVRLDLRGRSSGMFCTRQRRCWIRYNPWIFERHFQASLTQTVPHEVAHYICNRRFGRKVRPHGPEWAGIMRDFGLPPDVTSKLDIEGLPQRQIKRIAYRCKCRTHQLSSIRHNRVLRGRASYSCKYCNDRLVPV